MFALHRGVKKTPVLTTIPSTQLGKSKILATDAKTFLNSQKQDLKEDFIPGKFDTPNQIVVKQTGDKQKAKTTGKKPNNKKAKKRKPKSQVTSSKPKKAKLKDIF